MGGSKSAWNIVLGICVVALGTQALGEVRDDPPAPGDAPASAPAPAPAGGRFANAEELLQALETADKDLRTFTAKIQYTKVLPDIQGAGVHLRRGMIWFRSDPAPVSHNAEAGKPAPRPRRQFEVIFDTLVLDGKKREEKEQWVFDGEWLVEKQENIKQFIKRRVIKPGEDRDPLRIGEGPFPIPIGQRRADVLANFDAELVASLDGLPDNEALRALLADNYQLRLKPKAGTRQARDFRVIQMWYRPSDLMPVFASTTNTDDSRAEVFLLGQKRNVEIETGRFSVQPPPPDSGWVVQIDGELPPPVTTRPVQTPGTTIKP